MKDLKNNKNCIKYSLLDNTSKYKLKKADTLILDNKSNIYYIDLLYKKTDFENLLLVPTNDMVNLDLSFETTLKNISFLNYPNLGGITIPFDVLKNMFFKINISNNNINWDKLNVITNNGVKTINIKDNIAEARIFYNSNEDILDVRLVEKYKDINKLNIKRIQFNKEGIYKEFYERYYINNSGIVDLRNYNALDIYLDGIVNIDKLIIDTKVLKDIKLKKFNNVRVDELEIIENNDMKLIPKKLVYKDCYVTIKNGEKDKSILIRDSVVLEKEIVIYLDENNEFQIINGNVLHKTYVNEISINLLNKNKSELNYTLYSNGKIYKIDKVFINWCLANNINIFISEEYRGKYSIFQLNNEDIKNISDYIFDKIKDIIYNYDKNFDIIFESYNKYKRHIKFLYSKGLSSKALYYLHKYNYDNITGITNRYTESIIEEQNIIGKFNTLSKTLLKRKMLNESKKG